MEKQYETRIVAFVDILGFKEKIDQSVTDEKAYKKIYYALKQILSRREHIEADTKKGYNVSDIRVTTFSDSAVISYPLEPGSGNLFYILLDLVHLQIDLLQSAFLLRGGITVGKLYHDGAIIYGPAMNDAYALESRYACYPRIIIDQEMLLEGIVKTCSSHHDVETECEFVEGLVKRDKKDGYWYLDYLSQAQELDYPEVDYYTILTNIRRVILDGLHHDSKDVRKKYKWLRKYFNRVLKHNNHPVIAEMDIEGCRDAYNALYISKEDKHF